MQEQNIIPMTNGDAKFKRWQVAHSGEEIAIYTIIASGHPLAGFTATKRHLQELQLQVPEYSSP